MSDNSSPLGLLTVPNPRGSSYIQTKQPKSLGQMVYLRNLCSHHSRLWHREMVIASPVTKDMRSSYPDFDYEEKSVAGSLMALMYLVDSINGDNAYSRSVLDLIHERDDYLDGIVHPLHWE